MTTKEYRFLCRYPSGTEYEQSVYDTDEDSARKSLERALKAVAPNNTIVVLMRSERG